MLDRKVRNVDLGARTETFKYPPHMAQEGRSEGLLGHIRRIKYCGWIYLEHSVVQACFCRSLIEVDSNLPLIKLDLLIGQSVVRLVGCDQALDHIYTGTYAIYGTP